MLRVLFGYTVTESPFSSADGHEENKLLCSVMKVPSCPAHISTAVHQEEVLPSVRIHLSHSLDEVDHVRWHCLEHHGQAMEISGTGICLFTLEERNNRGNT